MVARALRPHPRIFRRLRRSSITPLQSKSSKSRSKRRQRSSRSERQQVSGLLLLQTQRWRHQATHYKAWPRVTPRGAVLLAPARFPVLAPFLYILILPVIFLIRYRLSLTWAHPTCSSSTRGWAAQHESSWPCAVRKAEVAQLQRATGCTREYSTQLGLQVGVWGQCSWTAHGQDVGASNGCFIRAWGRCVGAACAAATPAATGRRHCRCCQSLAAAGETGPAAPVWRPHSATRGSCHPV